MVAAMSRVVLKEDGADWPDDGWCWDYDVPWPSSDWWFEEDWSCEPYEDAPPEQEEWVQSVGRVEENKRVTKCDRIMLESGGLSTACTPSFAPEYEVDDTEKAKLRDI